MSSTFYKETDDMLERFELATERIATIHEDHDLPEQLQAYFNQVAEFVMTVLPVLNKAVAGTLSDRTIEECEADNAAVFAIYEAGKYENSFLCPTYAVEHLGQELGGPLSAVFYEITNIIEAAFAGRVDKFTIYCELFLQVYGVCQVEDEDKYRREDILSAIYSAKHDYSQMFLGEQIISMIDPAVVDGRLANMFKNNRLSRIKPATTVAPKSDHYTRVDGLVSQGIKDVGYVIDIYDADFENIVETRKVYAKNNEYTIFFDFEITIVVIAYLNS